MLVAARSAAGADPANRPLMTIPERLHLLVTPAAIMVVLVAPEVARGALPVATAGEGTVFISVNDRDKAGAVKLAKTFVEFGFQLAATRGTAAMLKAVPVASEEALLASLVLFRVIYYLVPFLFALALLGAHESFRRWNSLREAMRGSEEETVLEDVINSLNRWYRDTWRSLRVRLK